jgi:formiminotetrahydrofolate cyclodeaminase
MLVDQSVREFLGSLSASTPAPGGGAAAALSSAMGAALLAMVGALPKTRTGSPAERQTLEGAREAVDRLQRALTDAVDADAAAYEAVVSAYRLPKGTDAERGERAAAVQHAFERAVDVPLHVMRLSLQAMEHAERMAPAAHRPAASDLLAGTLLLHAGFEGARLNVEANLESLKDQDYVRSTKETVGGLMRDLSFESRFERLQQILKG